MAHTFKYNNSTANSNLYNDGAGKASFGNVKQNTFASDYITNKKAKLLYKTNYNNKKNGILNNQQNLLLFKRAQLIRDVETCDSLPAFDSTNLESGLYSNEELDGINIITAVLDTSNCPIYSGSLLDKTIISSNPFFYNYNIDKCGDLFGNNFCGIENYNHYKKIDKTLILNEQSLVKCNLFGKM